KLRTEGIEAARKQLSFIVGRDTADLNEEEVTKATVETVAENTTDGIVAPMLFMFIGGAPLTFLYKAVNTMDSMVGYRNEKYLYFGRCSARLDDLLNFLPARLAGVLMIAASYFLAYDYKGACRIFLRDRNNHLSPNSAQTEASCAGALNIELGGGHFYAGRFVPKQTIGEAVKKAELNDIKKANNLMLVTSVLSLALMAIIRLSIIFLKDVFHV
ncbi:MAG: adenosylcobinamide-phosphate synthase CbiB, partial [Acidaminococcaceae bacterium]|nr:adenosylcobinamide-phosphate synthase CbiB [Acidaminococcaceae bacterium]